MTALTLSNIKDICTDFVNDPDTTIGMECNWLDYLVKEVPHNFTSEQSMDALGLINTQNPLIITVNHEKYEETDVYVALYDKRIVISTKEYLL